MLALLMEWQLFIGPKFTGLTVCPDERYPRMWRIHFGDRVSDMVNLSRARDAAIVWARPRGLGGGEVARWRRRETAREPPSMRERSSPRRRGAPKNGAVPTGTPTEAAWPTRSASNGASSARS
jgi:hypothetical protein